MAQRDGGAWEGLAGEEADVMDLAFGDHLGSSAKGRRQGVDQSEAVAGIEVREAGVDGIMGLAVGMKINKSK